jgi:hypothetical protein
MHSAYEYEYRFISVDRDHGLVNRRGESTGRLSSAGMLHLHVAPPDSTEQPRVHQDSTIAQCAVPADLRLLRRRIQSPNINEFMSSSD